MAEYVIDTVALILRLEKRKMGAQAEQVFTDFDVVETAARITDIPELHDRLIAATAVYLAAPLVTDDGKISESAFVRTVW
jgi:PIN domain nuclease of toxin-antitoxin system